MERKGNDILADLDAVLNGRLDQLSPEQAARLEAYLNVDRVTAEALAARVATVEPVLRGGVPTPSAVAWERVWAGIDAARTARLKAAAQRRVFRIWQPLVAVAASVALLLAWNFTREPGESDWPVTWARDVEINELEVARGSTPLILSGEFDGGIPMIWVLDGAG